MSLKLWIWYEQDGCEYLSSKLESIRNPKLHIEITINGMNFGLESVFTHPQSIIFSLKFVLSVLRVLEVGYGMESNWGGFVWCSSEKHLLCRSDRFLLFCKLAIWKVRKSNLRRIRTSDQSLNVWKFFKKFVFFGFSDKNSKFSK
jgi:hypothetical protein